MLLVKDQTRVFEESMMSTSETGKCNKTSGGGNGSGLLEFKEKMKKMQATTVELNKKADELEEEKKREEEKFEKADEKRKGLLAKCEELAETSRRTEEKLKMMTIQMQDKELFLNESKNFHKFLSQDSVGEDKLVKLTKDLEYWKQEYENNAKRCRKAEKRRVKVTRQNEAANAKLKEHLKSIEDLKLKLEYGRIDESRKTASTEKVQRVVAEYEKDYYMLDAALKEMSRRKVEGYERVVTLKERIVKVRARLHQVQQDGNEKEHRTRDLRLHAMSSSML